MLSLLPLWLCALAISVLYLLFSLVFPLPSLHALPLRDLGQLAQHRPGAALALGAGAASAFTLYVAALRHACRLPGSSAAVATVLGGAALQAGVFLWAHPVGAVDVYDYIFRARIQVTYGLNPLTTTPAQLSGDQWYPFVAWDVYPSPYGPAWALVSAAATIIAGPSLAANLFVFKLLSVLCLFGTALLAAGVPGARAPAAGLLFVLWNPLALFETAVNGHNDTLMLLLVVAALRLHLAQRSFPAWLCAAFAVHVKLAALVILPVLWIGEARRSGGDRRALLRKTLSGIGTFAVVTALLYAPFWEGARTLNGILWLQGRDTSSLAAVLRLSADLLGMPLLAARAHAIFAALFGLAALWLIWRERDAVALARALLWTLLAIGTAWFQPWYVLWLLALSALEPAARRAPLVAVSAGALSLYLLFGFAWQWYPALFNWGNTLAVNASAVSLWLLIPLALTGWLRGLRRRSAGLLPRGP